MALDRKKNSMDNQLKREIVASILTTFPWGEKGIDQVEELLDRDPDGQEWVDELAADIVSAL